LKRKLLMKSSAFWPLNLKKEKIIKFRFRELYSLT
jgi:hypothetical protein